MARFLIFSSAANGNWLTKLLKQNDVEVCLSSMSPSDLVASAELHVLKEPQEIEDLATLLQSLQFDCAIDVSFTDTYERYEKRKAACAFSDIRYLRLVRTPCTGEECLYVDSGEKASEILSATTGKALLTIGVRDLDYFTRVPDFKERIYLRIRPSVRIIEQCLHIGFRQENLIAMEGPFSRELNGAMLRQSGVSLLVTRDGSDIADKLMAVRDVGATAVVIGKFKEDKGITYPELMELLEHDYGIANVKNTGYQPKFPFFVDLENSKILIFGGGTAAARRAEILLLFGQRISVIAPQFDPAFDRLEVMRIERPYLRGDCASYHYIFAVTGNKEINRTIAEEAHACGIHVYAEDIPEESDFAFPEIIHRDQAVLGAYFGSQERKVLQNLILSIGEQVDTAFAKK